MRRTSHAFVPLFGLALAGALLLAPAPLPARAAEAPPAAAASPLDAEALEAVNLAFGGRLYDDWLRELGEKAPPALPPLPLPAAAATADPATAWRCVTCHGWDYRGVGRADGGRADGGGADGVKGIDGLAGAEPALIRARLTAADHGYGEWLDDPALDALAAFVSHGQTSLLARLDPASGRPDAAPAPAVVQTVCARCHGGDGQAVASVPPLGDLARAEPARVLHAIINGHSGGVMPALRALDGAVSLGVLAALQDLPPRPPAAAMARGGRLYDTWYKEKGVAPPDGLHPAWPKADPPPADPRASWRCRECHGWGVAGAHGLPGPTTAEGRPVADLVAVLTNPTHGYGKLLSRRDLEDLALFLSAGQKPVDALIDPATGLLAGTGEGYGGHFQLMCAPCHGATGTAVRTMAPLARVVREEPRRALHSVLNGHPGESMPPLRVFPEDLAVGILAHAQGLPTKR